MIRFLILLLLPGLILLSSCGSSAEDTNDSNTENAQTDTTTPKLPNVASFADSGNKENEKNNKMNAPIQSEASNKLLESQAFKQIAEILPESLNGTNGGPYEGWATEVMPGVKFNMAKRAYRGGGKRLDLSIADAGNSTLDELNLAKIWLGKKIDRKLKGGGYEKNRTFNGFPAFEKCKNNYCELSYVIDQRFLVSAYGENSNLEEIEASLLKINPEELRALPK